MLFNSAVCDLFPENKSIAKQVQPSISICLNGHIKAPIFIWEDGRERFNSICAQF